VELPRPVRRSIDERPPVSHRGHPASLRYTVACRPRLQRGGVCPESSANCDRREFTPGRTTSISNTQQGISNDQGQRTKGAQAHPELGNWEFLVDYWILRKGLRESLSSAPQHKLQNLLHVTGGGSNCRVGSIGRLPASRRSGTVTRAGPRGCRAWGPWGSSSRRSGPVSASARRRCGPPRSSR